MTDETPKPIRREDQQLSGIITPHAHDVLMGRGNGAKDHIGNKNFRAIVDDHLAGYVACPKSNRGRFALTIIDKLRALDPPARFLEFDKKTNLWSDCGDDVTLRKVRQRFREKAPELEGKKDGGTGAAAAAASGKGKKAPPAESVPVASDIPTLAPEPCPSPSPVAAGVDVSDDDSIEYESDDSLDNIEPLAIEDDPIGLIQIQHSSCPVGSLQGSLIRRNGALNLSEQDKNYIQRQHGSLDLSTEMKVMHSDPRMTIHRQSGNLDLTFAGHAAQQSGVQGANYENDSGAAASAEESKQEHVVSTIPLNDQNNANRTHMMKDRSRSGRRTKFSRASSGSSETMTISGQTMSTATSALSIGENLISVFEEGTLPDGLVEGGEEQRPKEKQLADSMKKFSDMSLDDEDVMRSLEGGKKFSNMSLDDDGEEGIAPTPLKYLIEKERKQNPGSNKSLTLAQTVEYLGESAFVTSADGESDGGEVGHDAAQGGDRLPPNITLHDSKTFSEMSLGDDGAVSQSAAASLASTTTGGNNTELAPTKLPSDFSLTLSQAGSLLGDSTFSNTSISLIQGENEG